MTRDQFIAAAGISEARADIWYVPVEEAMFERAIVSPKRAPAFIATCGHESTGFTGLVENLNYSADRLLVIFKKYYTTDLAGAHHRKPELIGNQVYDGRMGNNQPGDGYKFRGRALIQITGRDNYTAVSEALGVDYLEHPEWLERPRDAARASAWWWATNGCNELADTGNFLAVSRMVNLGNPNSPSTPNGMADRNERYGRAVRVLG